MATFTKKGISAACICHEDDDDDDDYAITRSIRADTAAGKFQIVFFTPEALFTSRYWRKVLLSHEYQKRVTGLVIDEAHTLHKWLAQRLYSWQQNYVIILILY